MAACLYFFSASLLTLTASYSITIPSTFPDTNLSSYKVRYLSGSVGYDSEPCLDDQSSVAADNVSACRSLPFVLTGQSPEESTAQVMNLNMTMILVAPGEYFYNSGGIDVLNSSSIILAKDPRFEGEVIFRCSSLSENRFNNLFFEYVEHVALIGVTCAHCGLFYGNVAFQLCRDVHVRECLFRDNLSGGMTIDDSIEFQVEDTSFTENSASSSYISVLQLRVRNDNRGFRLGGALTLAFRENSASSNGLIRNCTFKNNRANLNKSNEEDAKHRPLFYIPRGHGGALLVFFEQSSNHTVRVERCSFLNNSAQIGGGAVAVIFYRGSNVISQAGTPSSRNNLVAITGNKFYNNTSERGGGAIVGLAFEEARDNHLVVSNCSVKNNSAKRSGGGLLVLVGVSSVEDVIAPIILTLDTTVFENNLAPNGFGGAIDLVAFIDIVQLIEAANITNCTFLGNHGKPGAVSSYRFPILLQGKNQWIDNSMSALVLTDSTVNCMGDISFTGNSGIKGGAIQMNGNSYLNLFEEVNIQFSNNSADTGGAIEVFTRGVDVNHLDSYSNCFVHYFDQNVGIPQWKVAVSFINNSVRVTGAAIYATDIRLCRYDNLEAEEGNARRPVLFELPFFIFENNSLVSSDGSAGRTNNIATESFRLQITSNSNSLSGAPGQDLSFVIRCQDQYAAHQPCIYSSNISMGLFFVPREGVRINYEVPSLSSYNLTEEDYSPCYSDLNYLLSQAAISFSLINIATGEVLNNTIVDLTITCCRPGFKLQNDTCVFDNSNRAILREDRNDTFLYLEPQHYAEVRNGTIVTAAMPVFYKTCNSQGNTTGCLFEQEQPTKQCRNGRTGFLCGVCPNGTSNDLTLSRCVTCHGWHTFFIVVIVLFFIIASSLIMVYNIRLTNEFKGFLFYAQVIGFIYEFAELTDGQVTWDFEFASILGINFYFPLCPYPGYSALYTAMLGFILPIVIAITIVSHILSAKFIKRLSNKTSFDGIWFLSFFIYKFIADTCFKILKCESVNLGDSYDYVYSYDGNLKCFSADNLDYLIFSIGAFILSVAVFIFPIFILTISFKRFQRTQNITDVLNRGIKPSRRWWSSFDLLRRVSTTYTVLILSYLSPRYSQLVLLFSCLVIFIVFALAKPYQSRRAIYIETALLLNMIIITCISLNTTNRDRRRFRPFSLILLLTPYIIVFIYLTAKVLIKFLKNGDFIIWTKITSILTNMQSTFKKPVANYQDYAVEHSEKEMVIVSDEVPLSEGGVVPAEENYIRILEDMGSSHQIVSFSNYREELLSD